MRIGIGVPNTPRRNAAPSVPGWVDTLSADYPIGPLSFIPGFDITLGTPFTTTPAGGLCTGIRIRLGTFSPLTPISLTFALYALGGAPLGNETLAFDPAWFGNIVQTTPAFPAVNLSPSSQYVAALWINGPNGPYNYAPIVPAGYLPQSFPKYTINVGVQSAVNVGLNYPANNNPLYATYIEPVML